MIISKALGLPLPSATRRSQRSAIDSHPPPGADPSASEARAWLRAGRRAKIRQNNPMLRLILPILATALLVGCSAPPRPSEPPQPPTTANQNNEELQIPAPTNSRPKTEDQLPTTQETKLIKAGNLKLAITVEHFPARASDEEGLWGGLPSYTSKIVKMTAQWGDEEEVPVPHSAYSDLMDPQGFEISQSNDDFLLKIDNANPARPYHAFLAFHEEFLTKRTVKDGEFPAEFNETTTYTITPVED